jgi:hypothetical protein
MIEVFGSMLVVVALTLMRFWVPPLRRYLEYRRLKQAWPYLDELLTAWMQRQLRGERVANHAKTRIFGYHTRRSYKMDYTTGRRRR